MNDTTVSPAQLDAVRAALGDDTVHLGHGVGTAEGERCTIAAIRLALRGRCDDMCDPCMSPTIHAWTIRVQDAMPLHMLNAPSWRKVAAEIAGSVGTDAVERARAALILEWTWEQLADEAVLAAARAAWDQMLTERTPATAYFADAYAAAATYALAAAAATDEQFWVRADPAGFLARLIDCGSTR